MALNSLGKSKLAQEMAKQKYGEAIVINEKHTAEKNHFRNLERCMNIQRIEREMAEAELASTLKEASRERQIEGEETLARELDKIKREELRDLKMRQMLRENCHELRQLESKLRTAYVSKELAAQRAEKEARVLEEKLKEKEACKILEDAVSTLEEMNRKKAEEEMKKKAIYRQELQDQMIINEKRKRYMYEEFLREKKVIDDIVARIHAEDEREIEEKMCKMRKTREEMDAFKTAQQIWRNKEREEIERENRRIQEFIMNKAIQLQNVEQRKNEMEEVKAKLTEKIAQKIYEEERKRKEREEIMQELYEEQEKQAVEQRHKMKLEKAIRQGIETRASLLRQMQEREEKLKQEAQADARYKEEIMAKMIEDEKLEQLSAQKKRMRMLQLRRDVEQMIMDRRQRRAEEMQLLMKLKEQEDLEAADRKRIIEEERLKMLQEHAKNLVGYLPKGVLREDDLPHLGTGIPKNC